MQLFVAGVFMVTPKSLTSVWMAGLSTVMQRLRVVHKFMAARYLDRRLFAVGQES